MNQFKPILLFLLLLLGLNPLNAQNKLKFSVADFDIDPFDLSAKDAKYEKKDGNGERYAIIKVTSTNPNDDLSEYNFNFGNMKHLAEEHDGVLWLYVQKNAKLVTITRNGYLPINKYDLQTSIESGKNYVMTIASDQKKVYMQMVQFNVKPLSSNAVVMVKSNKANSREELFGYVDATGGVAKNLPYGTYTYKVLAENYMMAEGRFTLDNKAKTLTENVELRPNFSEITFKVDADADIYINGELKGTRQWSGVLTAGSYYVECRQADHKPTAQTIEVIENDNKTVTLNAPEPITGIASIISNPLGADFSIDGKPYGITPQNIDLLVGKHLVDVSKIGYKPASQTFEVAEDQTVEVNVTLAANANTLIDSDPSNSKLYIDGKYKGLTPYKYDGEAGDHKIKLTLQGYEPIEKNVYLGDTEQISFTLEKKVKEASSQKTEKSPKIEKSNKIENSRNFDFYAEAGVGIGAAMNATVGVGAFIKNFNAEVDYSYGFKKSPAVYWYLKEQSSKYQPSLILAGKLGYRINFGNRINVTPQIGYKFTKLSEIEATTGGPFIDGSNCSCLSLGLRGYCKISSHFGISLSPEYAIGFSKSEGYKKLTTLGSKITELAEGFNAKVSLVITF